MEVTIMNDILISQICTEAVVLLRDALKSNLVRVFLYGSCARGNYTQDSDIDIAIITKCDRLEAKQYSVELSAIATELAMKYYAVVNFVCLPEDEFMQKRDWYPYFKNIQSEGKILYK